MKWWRWVGELAWVCWLVGLRINGDDWSEFHFSQSDELCCKIHVFFFFFSVLRKQIAERCVLVRLEYLYVDGL